MKKLFYKFRGLFIRMPRFECLKCGIAIDRVKTSIYNSNFEYPVCPICGKNDQVDVALGYAQEDLKEVAKKCRPKSI